MALKLNPEDIRTQISCDLNYDKENGFVITKKPKSTLYGNYASAYEKIQGALKYDGKLLPICQAILKGEEIVIEARVKFLLRSPLNMEKEDYSKIINERKKTIVYSIMDAVTVTLFGTRATNAYFEDVPDFVATDGAIYWYWETTITLSLWFKARVVPTDEQIMRRYLSKVINIRNASREEIEGFILRQDKLKAETFNFGSSNTVQSTTETVIVYRHGDKRQDDFDLIFEYVKKNLDPAKATSIASFVSMLRGEPKTYRQYDYTHVSKEDDDKFLQVFTDVCVLNKTENEGMIREFEYLRKYTDDFKKQNPDVSSYVSVLWGTAAFLLRNLVYGNPLYVKSLIPPNEKISCVQTAMLRKVVLERLTDVEDE